MPASTASTGFASWSAVGPPAARERTTRSTATSGVSSWTDRSLGDGHLESVGVAAEAHAGKALVESRGGPYRHLGSSGGDGTVHVAHRPSHSWD
ncbi:hypothetical protein KVH31_27385 [Streptomyces olivaceus]|uniref:hypothetical protein n=1 Tax=Streptomyces olivaceus TaxID=47716 RepID=UPI001CCB4EC5|nr:hypothetical protein [Streptomyces olivaceus]MBZ6210220.1 hypothetical protein [Streptomyces olivaceus]